MPPGVTPAGGFAGLPWGRTPLEIDLRGGVTKGAVIPATAFDVPAEQIIEELRRRPDRPR